MQQYRQSQNSWGGKGPTGPILLKHGHLELLAQHHIQVAFEEKAWKKGAYKKAGKELYQAV